MRNTKLIVLLLFITFSPLCLGMEKVFYVLRNQTPNRISAAKNAYESLSNHYQSIDLLISQAYQVDENGVVWGSIDPDILQLQKKHHIKLMLLFTNVKFDSQRVHQFLQDKKAQDNAINSIVAACQNYNCYGAQLDFEMINIADKDLLTEFYLAAAKALHQNGFKVSFAIAPVVNKEIFPSNFLKKIYINWEGAYDLPKLNEVADFFSLMAYNQHGGVTSPGATASINWDEATIQEVLKYVPKSKLSFGIPVYSNYWYTDNDDNEKITLLNTSISFANAKYLLKRYHAQLNWDDHAKIHYAIFEHNWLNEYIYIEDNKSFAAKLNLVKKYHLRGFSVFDLGNEDPAIWKQL